MSQPFSSYDRVGTRSQLSKVMTYGPALTPVSLRQRRCGARCRSPKPSATRSHCAGSGLDWPGGRHAGRTSPHPGRTAQLMARRSLRRMSGCANRKALPFDESLNIATVRPPDRATSEDSYRDSALRFNSPLLVILVDLSRVEDEFDDVAI